MKLGNGVQLGIVNLATDRRKWDESHQARFTIHDVLKYKGQLIVVGTSAARNLRSELRGLIHVTERLSSPIILPDETDINVCRLTLEWRGLPIALVQGNEVLVILNTVHVDVAGTGQVGKFWAGLDEKKKEDHITKSCRVIDRYHELKAAGTIETLRHRADMRFSAAGRLVGVGSKLGLMAPSDFQAPPQAQPDANAAGKLVLPGGMPAGFSAN